MLLLLLFVQPAGATGAQVVHAQQRTVTAAAAPAEVVAIATGQGVRAVTPVTASAVVSTTLSPGQSQTRPLVTQVTPGTELNIGIPLVKGFHDWFMDLTDLLSSLQLQVCRWHKESLSPPHIICRCSDSSSCSSINNSNSRLPLHRSKRWANLRYTNCCFTTAAQTVSDIESSELVLSSEFI